MKDGRSIERPYEFQCIIVMGKVWLAMVSTKWDLATEPGVQKKHGNVRGESMDHKSLRQRVLLYGLDEYFGLWNIIFFVNGGVGYGRARLPQWVQEQALQIIKELADDNLIVAGFPSSATESGFEALEIEPDQLVSWVKSEWDQLEYTPSIGDIVWFNLTPEGERIAKELEQNREA